MKRSLLRRSLIVGTAFTAAATTLLNGVPPAHAAVPAGHVAVASSGSDTTDAVMGTIMAKLNGSSVSVNGSATPVDTFNIPAFPASPGFTLPGDADCTDNHNVWTKDPLAPTASTAPTKGVAPFGSGSGRAYLKAERNPANVGSADAGDFSCVDVARSSSVGGSGETGFEYYAFALDAVSWATTSLKAPTTLTKTQIQAIYLTCTINDWSQVGGLPGPIVRYLPQPGSGTRSFFISEYLGGTTPNNSSGSCGSVAPLVEIEENEATAINPSDGDKAIMPYSVGVWTFQSKNPLNLTIDRRNGARLGATQLASGNPISLAVRWNAGGIYEPDPTVVTEANVNGRDGHTPTYPGVRFVYNVLDNTGNRAGYQAALGLVGVSSTGAKGPLCDNGPGFPSSDVRRQLFSAITSNGFQPLPTTGGTSGSNPFSATCRFYPGNT